MKIIKNLLFITLTSAFLMSCGEKPETRKYSEYSEFSFNDVTTMYNLEGNHYYVQFYSETCPHCENTKSSLFDYLDKFKENKVSTKVYIFNAYSSGSDQGQAVRLNFKVKPDGASQESLIEEMNTNKPQTVGETYWFGIPCVYEISDGKYQSFLIGSESIKDLYSKLK